MILHNRHQNPKRERWIERVVPYPFAIYATTAIKHFKGTLQRR